MVKNNYSSGRNDDRIAHPNGKNVPQEFAEEGDEQGVLEKDVMVCHSYSAVGNMNLNRCTHAAPRTPAVENLDSALGSLGPRRGLSGTHEQLSCTSRQVRIVVSLAP